MTDIAAAIARLKGELPSGVELVAVSKFHPASMILEAYGAGQRVFGESRPQEFAAKADELPGDIEWHFIGHLQTNKLKLVLPRAAMVESVDSLHLLEAIDRWGNGNGKVVDVLLEYHIASEETKQGFDRDEILGIMSSGRKYGNVRICGLMGMATYTDDASVVRMEFRKLTALFDEIKGMDSPGVNMTPAFSRKSFGMTHDYRIALEEGADIVRIGTLIFGERNY